MAFLAIAPTGTVLPFAGTTAPDGWLLCDGTAKSRTSYAKLFAVISTTYGAGDGSTTFNVPDMRGVFPRGSGTNGTANYGGVTGHTPAGGSLAAKGGQKTAKNGLSATANSSSVSGTTSLNHSHSATSVSGTTNIGHTHGASSISVSGLQWANRSYGFQPAGSQNRWDDRYNAGGENGAGGSAGGQSLGTSNVSLASGSAGGQSLTGTNNSALSGGSATAQAITVGNGDTETAPASLSLNYIIKL